MNGTLSSDIARFVAGSGPWMAWNTLLALLPWSLALIIFDRNARPRRLWWVGAAACVVLLPNTAYVLTDIVHLPTAIRAQRSDLVVLGVILPTFAALFAIGFLAYVDIVRRIVGWLRATGRARNMWPVVIVAHGLTAIGIYAGRVLRFNSWDLVLRPVDVVVQTLGGFGHPTAVAGMVIVFAFLTIGYAVAVFAFEALSQAIAKPIKN
jgi:uncharacterized membrane protein